MKEKFIYVRVINSLIIDCVIIIVINIFLNFMKIINK
jgi:hypothetical protein